MTITIGAMNVKCGTEIFMNVGFLNVKFGTKMVVNIASVDVKSGMEIVVNIMALHIWDTLLEYNAVYHVSSKRRLVSTELQGVTSHKAAFFRVTTLKT
jgi:hypothetical protein